MDIYAELMGWPLDSTQQQAAATRGPIMITGGPHSGKSYTVVERTAFLLADTDPSGRVACLAVREDGTAHLRAQLQAHPRARRHLDRVFVGTVDECAESYLRSQGREALGLDPGFSLWSEDEAVEIMTLILRNLPELKPERGVIRDALRHRWENRRRRPDAVTATPARDRNWLAIAEIYGVAQSRHHALDRHDLPREAWQALEKSARTPPLAASLDRARFRHVVVDQGEELTRAQAEFVRRMVAPQGSLSVAGDQTQAINPEADPQILEYLSLARPKAFELPGRYNASGRLVQLAQTFRRAHGLPAPGDDRDSPAGPAEPAPEMVVVEGTLSDMDRHVLEEVQRLRDAGVPWEEMAVLDRRGHALGRMKTTLLLRGIPHHSLGKAPPAGPTDARFIAAVLSLALNPRDPVALRIAGAPGHPNRRRVLPDATVHLIMREAHWLQGSLPDAVAGLLKKGRLRDRDGRPLECLMECLGLVDRYLSEDGHTLLDLLTGIRELSGRLEGRTLLDLLTGIRELSGRLEGRTAGAAADAATEGLLDLAEAMAGPEGEDRRGRLRRFLSAARQPELAAPAGGNGGDNSEEDVEDRRGVAMGSIHDAKGISRRVVFFLDVSDEAIPGDVGPHSSRVMPEAMLFHVAISRATGRLYLYRLSDTGMSGHSTPSRFLEPIAGLLRQSRVPFRQADPFAEDPWRHLHLERRDRRPWDGPPVPTLRGPRRRGHPKNEG